MDLLQTVRFDEKRSKIIDCHTYVPLGARSDRFRFLPEWKLDVEDKDHLNIILNLLQMFRSGERIRNSKYESERNQIKLHGNSANKSITSTQFSQDSTFNSHKILWGVFKNASKCHCQRIPALYFRQISTNLQDCAEFILSLGDILLKPEKPKIPTFRANLKTHTCNNARLLFCNRVDLFLCVLVECPHDRQNSALSCRFTEICRNLMQGFLCGGI